MFTAMSHVSFINYNELVLKLVKDCTNKNQVLSSSQNIKTSHENKFVFDSIYSFTINALNIWYPYMVSDLVYRLG